MSNFRAFRELARAQVYTAHYRTEDNPFGSLSSVHPLHPMRRMNTVRVATLADMQTVLPVGMSLRGQNKMREEFIYILFGGPKPELDIYADNVRSGIIPLAATVLVQEEVFDTPGGKEAITGLLWRKVDAIEAILWWNIFTGQAYSLSPPNPVESFREIFAIGRAFLMRVNPDVAFEALMSPRAYGAMLLDNAAGANQDTSLTEHHMGAGAVTPIPVAMNYRSMFDGGSYNTEIVAIYPSSLTAACTRYIYEVEHVDKVRDATEDKNLIRITCERYLTPAIPFDYYSEAGIINVIPVVSIDAGAAISSIASKYSAGTLANLDYIASEV